MICALSGYAIDPVTGALTAVVWPTLEIRLRIWVGFIDHRDPEITKIRIYPSDPSVGLSL
jgi:hypothetical protein